MAIPDQEGKGNCAAIVRMRDDFFPSALPFPDGRYLDPGAQPSQKDTFHAILAGLDALQLSCISRQKTGGWMTIGENIVAAIWPVGSVIDGQYGMNISETEGRRFLQQLNATQVFGH